MIARRGLAALSAAALATLATLPAHAQQTTFYLDRIQISGAPDDGFAVFRPRLYPRTRFYGMAALGYTLNPLRKETVTDDPQTLREVGNPVQNQLIAYLVAGAEIAGTVGVSVALPIALFQDGSSPAGFTEHNVGDGFGVKTADVHDLRLDARVPIYHSNNGKFHWGLGAAIWLPVGDQFSFDGDGQTTGYPYTALEYDFDRFVLAGTIGPQFRPTRAIDNANGDLFLGSDLRWALGGYLPLRDGKYRIGLELFGNTGITSERVNGTTLATESKFFAARTPIPSGSCREGWRWTRSVESGPWLALARG